MVNTTYKSSEDKINKLQSLKGKTKLKFYKNLSKFYDQMSIRRQSGNFQIEEDPSSRMFEVLEKKIMKYYC